MLYISINTEFNPVKLRLKLILYRNQLVRRDL